MERKTTLKETLLIKIVTPLIGIIALFGIFLALLWKATPELLFWLAAISLTVVPLSFIFGFWFGKTEVRGWLAGADTVLDKMAKSFNTMDMAVERAAKRSARNQGNVNLVLPGNVTQPLLESGEVIDAQVLEM